MANILDYLHWRGDLDFTVSPFNEVDAVILTMLSYLDLTGIVDGCESSSGITLKETSDRYFSKFSASEPIARIGSIIGLKSAPTVVPFFNANLEELLRELPDCPRFGRVRVACYKKDHDDLLGQQLTAVTFNLAGAAPENLVAFGGTDNTLVGWKEDLKIIVEQMPAQDAALRYLEDALDEIPGGFLVCGHSKGGNLAVYAGSHIRPTCQDRIIHILNFDGPGFDFSIVDPVPFNLYKGKILNIVPEESVVGMLLDSVGERKVISSSARYVRQHDTFEWEVRRTEFAPGKLADIARLLDHTITTWLQEMTLDERAAFLDALFNLLGDSDGTLNLLDPLKTYHDIRTILRKYSRLDPEAKSLLNRVFESFSTQAKRTVSATILQKLPGKE